MKRTEIESIMPHVHASTIEAVNNRAYKDYIPSSTPNNTARTCEATDTDTQSTRDWGEDEVLEAYREAHRYQQLSSAPSAVDAESWTPVKAGGKDRLSKLQVRLPIAQRLRGRDGT